MLISISRPRFWLYTAGPYLLGYTASSASLYDLMSPAFLGTLIYFMIPANFYLYGINDLFDRDTDILNPKKGSKEVLSLSVGVKVLVLVIASSLLISLLALIFLQGLSRIFLGIFVALSTIYSAPPIRLKSKALLDSYSNALYAMPLLVGYAQNTNNVPGIDILIASISWSAAMHAFSAIPDIEYDKKAGLRTVATLLGWRGALLFCAANWGVASIVAVWRDILLLPSLIYPLIPVYILVRGGDVEKIYWRFPLINSTMGFLAFIYIIYKKGFLAVL